MKKAEAVVKIRRAEIADLPAIVEIYNEAILEGGKTADLSTFSAADRILWFNACTKEPYVILVAELDNSIAGYAYTSPWRPGREALNKVAEVSFYLSAAFRGRGLGSILVNRLIKDSAMTSLENLLAILLDINEPSIRLLERSGFRIAGKLPGIVNLRDKQCGQLIYLRSLMG